MGGKKKPNRTKGNVRPSSSGRSAELLCSSGTSTSGFIGFSGLSYDALSYVPATSQTCEEIDIAVDSDFRLVMRKMTKKDDTTKLKAMQEFSDLCRQKDEDTLKGALPFWPRLYNRLAMEHDRRVREATHKAHQELIKKVGRNLAPHLRSIMGVWLVSQCDPYGPAATAAKSSFHEAFPEAKQSEALMFCKDELFNYIQDTLFNQTLKTVGNSTTLTQEEIESKFHRILKCSLDGLSLFILTITCKEYQKIENNIDEILKEPKFWKFAKHADSMVQLSWYNLTISLCDKMPQCIIPHASKVCPLTLGKLAGDDSVLIPLIWESSLHVLNIIEDCWKHVNVKKAVLPQLWSVLKNGGHGNAVILFPRLLPLLSKIPCDVVGDNLTFYQLLFQNTRASLSLEKVQNSHIECNAIVQAFMECIQYVLSKFCHNEQDEALQQHIVLNQLLPVLETSIIEEKCHLSRSCLYPKLKKLLDYFRDQASLDKCNTIAFERILGLFWDNFFIMCNSVMDGDALVRDRGLSRLSKFFCCLHNAGNTKYKEKRKVDFNEDPVVFKDLDEHNEIKLPSSHRTTSIAAGHHIVGPTQELCSKAMMKFETTKNLPYLKLLCEVMGTVASKELFSVLLKSSMNLSVCPDDAPVEYFYQALCPWILEIDSFGEKKRTYAVCLVNIAVSICSTVSEEMAKKILDDFTKSKNSILLECLIENATFVPKESILRLWLHESHVGKMVVSHAEDLCKATLGKIATDNGYIDSVWNILHLCLTSSECSEPIIGTEYLSEILEIFHHCLMNSITNTGTGKRQVIEFVCDLSSRLFSGFKGCWQLKAAEDLLLCLFLLDCDPVDPADAVVEKLSQSWQLGVKHLLAEKSDLLHPDGFFFKAAMKIHDQVIGQISSMKSGERLAATTLKLLSIMNEALETDCNETINPLICSQLEIIFPSEEEWNKLRDAMNIQCLTSAILDQKLMLTDSQAILSPEASLLSSHCLVSLFVSEVFIAVLNISQKDTKYFVTGDRCQDVILNQVHNITVAVAYCTYAGYGYKTTKSCTEGKVKMLLYEKLMHNAPLLLSTLNENSYMALMDFLSNMSLNKGNIWPLCMALVISLEARDASIKVHLTHLSRKINYEEIYHLQTLRAIIPYLNTHCVIEIVKEVTNILLCTEEIFTTQGASYLLSILVSCVEVKDILNEEAVQEHISTILEFLLGIKNLDGNKFLENCALSMHQDIHLYFIANVMSLFEKILLHLPTTLDSKHWDFLLCTLVGWIQSCNASKSFYRDNLPVLRFCVQAFGLLSAVVDVVNSRERITESDTFPPNLVTEWHELFAQDIYKISLPLYMNLAETSMDNNRVNIGREALLQNMAKALQYIPAMQVECEPPFKHTESSSKIFYLLDRLVPLLICGIRSVQLTSHFLLMKIMPQLAKEMSEKEKTEEDQRYPPSPFVEHLQQTGPVVETMLSDFRIGDCCVLEPYTDAYTYGRAYLFAWIELLEFFYCASSEERSEYASYLCDKGLIDTMLNSLFCLMPHNPSLSCERGSKTVQVKKQTSETMFIQQPSLAIDGMDTSFELQHIACQLYLSALQKLPALVRQWWTNQEKRTAEIVNKFTSNYVSGCICSREIQSVQEDDKKFINMLVKPRPSAREVVATYTIDEVTIELMIQLPSNHPLGPIVVESGRRVGVAQTQWRNWMLQLTTFLTHQNGSILEGLALWKRNVDKRFEGVEECMICFYVVHGSTCQLPRLTCRTCKKKFHSACLYKWFSTSNNSSCPLCRNLF